MVNLFISLENVVHGSMVSCWLNSGYLMGPEELETVLLWKRKHTLMSADVGKGMVLVELLVMSLKVMNEA
jgi:hypothetical protein